MVDGETVRAATRDRQRSRDVVRREVRPVIHASLNYFFTRSGETKNGRRGRLPLDGRRPQLAQPVVVSQGRGADSDPHQIFNDKEWIATDNNSPRRFYGRRTSRGRRSRLASAPYTRFADPGVAQRRRWAHVVTGARDLGGQQGVLHLPGDGQAHKCDEDLGVDDRDRVRRPVVSVAFMKDQHQAAWEPGETLEDQYLAVRSTDGGANWSRPAHVVDLEDGSRDYPLNVDGRQTLTGYQVRVWSPGNIAADPRTGALYLTFSDNRFGLHDVDNPQTDTKVFVMSAADGVHWTGLILSICAAATSGSVRRRQPRTRGAGSAVQRRRQDGSQTHEVTLATGSPGAFTLHDVTTAASDPTNSASSRPAFRSARSAHSSTATTSASPTGPTGLRTPSGQTCASPSAATAGRAVHLLRAAAVGSRTRA